jgi:hypothetical protein
MRIPDGIMNIYARQRMYPSVTRVLKKITVVTYNIHGLFKDGRLSVNLRRSVEVGAPFKFMNEENLDQN